MKSLGKASICDPCTRRGIKSWTWRWDTFDMFIHISQRCFLAQRLRHVNCSEMYLIVILNPKKTKASAEERDTIVNIYTNWK
jgi:hypothetical protein